MTLSLMEARNAVINHYMDTRNYTRKQAEDYIHDDARVFWLLEEVQKEVELSKRVGKRIHFIAEDGFPFYETFLLDEKDDKDESTPSVLPMELTKADIPDKLQYCLKPCKNEETVLEEINNLIGLPNVKKFLNQVV